MFASSVGTAFVSLLILGAGYASPGGQQSDQSWPPISKEELALKDNPAEPGASAMILYRESSVDDTESFEKHYYRIKVFTDKGKKYADVEIPYLEKERKVEAIRARTIRPDGTVVDFDGQVYDRLVVRAKKARFLAKTFSLHDVQKGSIIEYTYKVHWREELPDVLIHPDEYIIKRAYMIPTAHWTVQEQLFTRRADFSMRPRRGASIGWSEQNLGPGTKPNQQADGSYQLSLENIPAFEEEEYMPPESVVESRVDFFYTVGFLGDEANFWGAQGKERAEEFEKFIGNSNEIKRTVYQIVAPNDPPEAKLRKLYDRAQQIRYLSFEPAKTEKEKKRESIKDNENVSDVLKRGYAAAHEINLLFVAMARAAGFQSSPVEVMGRDSGFFAPKVYDRGQLNAMVAWVRAGSTDAYFDPATRYCPFNLLPWNETAAGGILEGNSAGKLVTTPDPKSTDAVVERRGGLQLDADGNIQGTLRVIFSGQEALQRRIENRERDGGGRRKALEDELKSSLTAGAAVELKNAPAWEDSHNPLTADFEVKIPSVGIPMGHHMVLAPSVFEAREKYPFQTAKRTYPIYFDYPYQEIDDLTIKPPAGYSIEALPATRSKTMPFGSYEVSYQNESGAARVHRRLVFDKFYIPVKYYSALRIFFDNARAGDEQQMVLKAEDVAQKK